MDEADDEGGWSPEVGVLQVAAPCKADWNAMQGSDQVRFCTHCKLNVYNLSGMSPDAARAVVKASEGGALCMRFFQRPDGTVTVAQCPPGLSARSRKRWAVVAASGTTALALSLLGVQWVRPSAEGPATPLPAKLPREMRTPATIDQKMRHLLRSDPAFEERHTMGAVRSSPALPEPAKPEPAKGKAKGKGKG